MKRSSPVVLVTAVIGLAAVGCTGGDGGSSVPGTPSATTSPSLVAASIPAEVLQFRPVEAITRDSEVTCGGPDVPCTDELLLNDSGITLRGPDPETYGVVSFELGDLLITGEDVAVASITETNMGDEELQGTDWSLNLQLTDEAASTSRIRHRPRRL